MEMGRSGRAVRDTPPFHGETVKERATRFRVNRKHGQGQQQVSPLRVTVKL
jgi:hypothetical protein